MFTRLEVEVQQSVYTKGGDYSGLLVRALATYCVLSVKNAL
jgi:hypothetical protein